jgi:uncharacterized membrane protein YdjX (TVP38/TMEM64 family)
MATRTAGVSLTQLFSGRRAMVLGLALLAIIGIGVIWTFVPLGEWMWNFTSWIRELGNLGFLVFAALFVLAVLIMAPASVLYMAAGLLYDLFWGFVISLVAASVGAVLQFLIARYLARDRVRRVVEERAEFEAVDRAVEEEGWKVVLLLRLAPLVPGNTQGWLFGATRVSVVQFAWPSVIGILPWALFFVGIGSAGAAFLYSGENPFGLWQWALLGAGIVALGFIVWLVGRRARAKLERMGIDGQTRDGQREGQRQAA